MITPSFSLTATERVLPKLALDFTTASLDPRVTFTRSGNTATVVNSSGLVATINADLPRFDYDPTTLACKGLLIEEARTNICLQSQDFSTTWVNSESTEATDVVASPDGTQNADKLIENTSSLAHQLRQVLTTTAVAHTFTVYAKAAERSWIALGINDSSNTLRQTYFDIGTGAIGTVGTNITASIFNAGNGWYRCVVTVSAAYAGSNSLRIYLATGNGGITYTGDGTSGVYVWGAQLEAGAFATSYIPTTTTALTRNADVATMTGTNFSDWYNQNEGTFECQFILQNTVMNNALINVINSGGSYNKDSILMYANYNNTANSRVYTYYGTTNQVGMAPGSTVLDTPCSITFGYKTNDCAGSLNGLAPKTATTFTPTTDMSEMYLGVAVGSSVNKLKKGYLQKINYWPSRLTDAEVQAFSKG